MNDEELLVYLCVCETLVCCSFIIMFAVVRDRVCYLITVELWL